jgi:hypothetical protein
MNKWDLRRLISGSVTGVAFLPFIICLSIGLSLRWTGNGLVSLADSLMARRHKVHVWANPEVYGKAPPRLRKLLYRRSTVERLVNTNESLRRIIDKQQEHLNGGGNLES